MTRQRRTFAIDFDGVLHRYSGWKDGKIEGPIDGALEGIEELRDAGHEVVVFTTRDKELVELWLERNGFPALEVTNVKRSFYVLVDDRAISFEGSWDGMAQRILGFEPYWVRNRR